MSDANGALFLKFVRDFCPDIITRFEAYKAGLDAPALRDSPLSPPAPVPRDSPMSPPTPAPASIASSVAASSGSDSESEMEYESAASPQPGTSEGFTTVARGKKRARAVEPSAAPKQPKAANASRPKVVVSPDSPRRATPSPRPGPAPVRKVPAPPPVILREKSSWDRVSLALKANKINVVHARNIPHGIQIKVESSDDHRSLTAYLRKERIGYHTYALQEERELRVVIRGVPKELDVEQIKNDLVLVYIAILKTDIINLCT
ncbi:uncharacterized protein LOC134199621 [Bombyx mori]|uniref:uncharacterized protein LOC134199621 n=1 Tax=Bombyx mori TaxID=7091 RepID=UPI002ED3B944